MLKSSPIRMPFLSDCDLFYNFSFGATKSSFAMLGMSAGINSSPTSWEIEMTALVGEQLSTFVKTGLPSGNVPKFNTNGEYIKGKDHSDFVSNLETQLRLTQSNPVPFHHRKSLNLNSL